MSHLATLLPTRRTDLVCSTDAEREGERGCSAQPQLKIHPLLWFVNHHPRMHTSTHTESQCAGREEKKTPSPGSKLSLALALHFGPTHSLTVTLAGTLTKVTLCIPLKVETYRFNDISSRHFEND